MKKICFFLFCFVSFGSNASNASDVIRRVSNVYKFENKDMLDHAKIKLFKVVKIQSDCFRGASAHTDKYNLFLEGKDTTVFFMEPYVSRSAFPCQGRYIEKEVEFYWHLHGLSHSEMLWVTVEEFWKTEVEFVKE